MEDIKAEDPDHLNRSIDQDSEKQMHVPIHKLEHIEEEKDSSYNIMGICDEEKGLPRCNSTRMHKEVMSHTTSRNPTASLFSKETNFGQNQEEQNGRIFSNT